MVLQHCRTCIHPVIYYLANNWPTSLHLLPCVFTCQYMHYLVNNWPTGLHLLPCNICMSICLCIAWMSRSSVHVHSMYRYVQVSVSMFVMICHGCFPTHRMIACLPTQPLLLSYYRYSSGSRYTNESTCTDTCTSTCPCY